ncbi:PREDICTED: nitrogen permease regulator 2-like protein isoform X2 [Priapulus caudatus]|uniref:Nitrogen permease regulator 2-like protein isoform X2 n=1 Tax=Priapulus caudatus TaxID=37621 RepID=A0ABM1ECX7_PRICU|nr:PREDICTED: nitrogen permease regulator 2-like protein isoform X2 [Priapulus caudatus]
MAAPKESKIECLLFSEFHPTAGPKIMYQFPENYIDKELFDAIHIYIITKPQLQGRLIMSNAFGKKIMGCPVCIDHPKYARNALIFNLCFVFDGLANSRPYEKPVRKLSRYLVSLERESGFLSNEESKQTLPRIMAQILTDLNEQGSCAVEVNQVTTIYLKTLLVINNPGEVHMYDVPIFTVQCDSFHSHQWDLTTQQILPYIDGMRHVARISVESDVAISLVKSCLQNMLYYGIIKLLPIFQYSNVYTVTSKINRLAQDRDLQNECNKYVAKPGQLGFPCFRDIFMLFCSLGPGTPVKDWCARHNPQQLKVDERRLIQFGVLHGLLRRIHKYPVLLTNEPGSQNLRLLSRWLNGQHHYDEICCRTGLSYSVLDEMIEDDPTIVVCWK